MRSYRLLTTVLVMSLYFPVLPKMDNEICMLVVVGFGPLSNENVPRTL